MNVYVTGPNDPMAEEALREIGYDVVTWREWGDDWDVTRCLEAEALILLPGYESCVHSLLEVTLFEAMDGDVYHLDEALAFPPDY